MLFTFLERLESRVHSKRLGRAFDRLGEGAPSAGALIRFTAHLVDLLP